MSDIKKSYIALGSLPVLALAMLLITLFSASAYSSASQAGPEVIDEIPVEVEEGDTVAVIPASEDPGCAAYAFLKMPRQYLDILTISMREEMVIYMEADSVLRDLNVYMGESWIEKMTQDYIKVHLSDASDIAIKVLPLTNAKNGKPLFMSLYTVTADNSTSDTTIKFFIEDGNGELQEQPLERYFKLPEPGSFYDFPTSMSREQKQEIFDLMPFYTVKYSIGPLTDTLTGRLTISEYLTIENKEKVEKYLNPVKTWFWDGRKFKENN